MAPRAALASAMLLLRAVAFSPARMPANPSRARWVTTASKTRWTNPAEWFKSKANDQDSANATQDGDITSSPVFLKKKVDVLTKELEDYSAKIEEVLAAKQVVDEEWGPKLQNLRNEYSAIRERTYNASVDALSVSTADVLKEVLPVTDNFYRAKDQINAETDREKEIAAVYETIGQKLQDVFAELGVVETNPVGEDFDPMLHEAVYTMPSEYEEGKVAQVMQPGFAVGNRVVRPAYVAVSDGP